MKRGDRVQVINPRDLMCGEIGVFHDLTREGDIVVRFPGQMDDDLGHFDVPYDPHDLELAPVTLWELAGISGRVAA